VLDEARVQSLAAIIGSDPGNAGARVQLANEYYDAEMFDEAIAWYEQALAIDPALVDASTDLGVSYYYTGQTDRALEQFDYSLGLDPAHAKTLLNQGIVLAFGRQDIASAAEAWRRVVEIAPDSPEGQTANQALQSMTAAEHTGAAAP
jgi:tetratricopeptide (TPR) repeat protein